MSKPLYRLKVIVIYYNNECHIVWKEYDNKFFLRHRDHRLGPAEIVINERGKKKIVYYEHGRFLRGAHDYEMRNAWLYQVGMVFDLA